MGEIKMNETYNNLKELAKLYRGTEVMEEIALNYQDEEDAILLSYVFCKNIGLTYQVTDKYFGLTEDDLSSFALEELHKAMINYRPNGGAKLTTLYSRFLNNRLRTETKALAYDKRKANVLSESLEGEMTEDDKGNKGTTGMEIGYIEDNFTEVELLMSLVNRDELTDNEYRYCEIIVKEVKDITQIKDSEIASRLNISSAAVHYIKKSLQKKIGIKTNSNFLLNF